MGLFCSLKNFEKHLTNFLGYLLNLRTIGLGCLFQVVRIGFSRGDTVLVSSRREVIFLLSS